MYIAYDKSNKKTNNNTTKDEHRRSENDGKKKIGNTSSGTDKVRNPDQSGSGPRCQNGLEKVRILAPGLDLFH